MSTERAAYLSLTPPFRRLTPAARELVMTERARSLRRNATPAERALWRALHAEALQGAKARRQVPCGPYIVDFLLPASGLVIELDGFSHDSHVGQEKDSTRDAWLAARGFRVLRFANADVLENPEGVIEQVRAALQHPHPGPLPEGEGEESGALAAPSPSGRGPG